MVITVSSSRTNMFSVMAHSGFGAMTIYRPDGITVQIPQNQITNHGLVKKAVKKQIGDTITIEHAQKLAKKGVILYIGRVG